MLLSRRVAGSDELDQVFSPSSYVRKWVICVPVNRIETILNGQRRITADTALRLARYFGATPNLRLNLQQTWELRRAEIETGREIDERVAPRQLAA